MRIGIDVDGVLARYTEAFQRRIISVTGGDRFPCDDYQPTSWDYAADLGYSEAEIDLTWRTIKEDRCFWASLLPYRDASHALGLLSKRMDAGDDVYFITARPGADAKRQTEQWLLARFPSLMRPIPTVLISSHKGLAAQTLGLDAYVDDRWENCVDVAAMHWKGRSPACRTYVLDRPWNHGHHDHPIIRVPSIAAMLTDLCGDAWGDPTPQCVSAGTSSLT
jgi:hypothetical protein